jgi:hypothetical protein
VAGLVLGPLLRYAGSTQATVWVETDAPCEVVVLDGRQRTFSVEGHHYALVVLRDLEEGSVRSIRSRGGVRSRVRRARASDLLAAPSAYTDSRSDIQLLQAVGHPYAVNPDRALKKAALTHGWPLLRFSSGRLPLAEAEAALLLDLDR